MRSEAGRDAAGSAAPVSGLAARAGSAAPVSGWASRATEPVHVIDTRDDFIQGEKTWAEVCSESDSSTADMGTVPASGTPAPGTGTAQESFSPPPKSFHVRH